MYLPAKPIQELSAFELALGKHHYFFCGAETSFNSSTSTRIARHKFFANRLLEAAEIPVPKAVLLEKHELKNDAYAKRMGYLKFPLVVKPLNAKRGTGVLCNIQTPAALKSALTDAFASYDPVIVEEFHANLLSYRVLVFNQRILGVVLRHPSNVIGDGAHSIQELVPSTNAERKRINEFLGPISLDEEARICLQEQGIGADYIPRIGEKIALGYTSNATRGGTYETVSKKICKENRKLMIRVANTLNLQLVGIDVQCADINIPIQQANGVIIETNDTPSVRIHEIPMYGHPNFVTRKIMRHFIYRHPLSYLSSLYFNKQTAFLLRSLIVAVILVTAYMVVPTGSI